MEPVDVFETESVCFPKIIRTKRCDIAFAVDGSTGGGYV